ncbi:hypothetical protein E4U58_001873, partial [Claviceps cyperi]
MAHLAPMAIPDTTPRPVHPNNRTTPLILAPSKHAKTTKPQRFSRNITRHRSIGKGRWSGPHKLLSIDGETCVLDMPKGPTKFRSTVVRPYLRDKNFDDNPQQETEDESTVENGEDNEDEKNAENPADGLRVVFTVLHCTLVLGFLLGVVVK